MDQARHHFQPTDAAAALALFLAGAALFAGEAFWAGVGGPGKLLFVGTAVCLVYAAQALIDLIAPDSSYLAADTVELRWRLFPGVEHAVRWADLLGSRVDKDGYLVFALANGSDVLLPYRYGLSLAELEELVRLHTSAAPVAAAEASA